MPSNSAEFSVELEDDVTPAARRASSSLARLQKSFEKFSNSSVGKMASQVAGWAAGAVKVAAAAAAGVAGAVGAMTVSMVDFNQRSMVAFGSLARAGEVPEQLFQRSIDLAKQFGLDIKDTTQAVIRFRAFGFDQGQSETLIKMGADMRALGATTDQVSRAFLAFSQIKAAGRLQGDELNQLAEAGIPVSKVYEQLGKALGKTVPEIIKLKEAGGIDASMAMSAIKEALLATTQTKAPGEAGQKIADQTLGGAAGRLKAGFDDMFRRAAVQAEPVLVKAFAPLTDRLMQLFDDPRTAAAIGSAVGAVADAIGRALPFIEKFISAFGEGFMSTLPAVMDGFSMMLDAFGAISGSKSTAETVAMIGKALGEVAAIIVGGLVFAIGAAAAAIVYITAIWNFWKGILMAFVDAIGGVVFAIVDFFSNVSAIFNSEGLSLGEKAFAIGKAIVQGIVNGIKALINVPVQVLTAAASGWIGAVKGVLGIASPSKVFEDMGMNTALGFQLGVEGEMPTVQGVSGMLGASSGMAPAATGGGGSVTFAPNITVPISGPATKADGEAFAAGIEERLFRKFSQMLEGAAIEAGA